MTSILLIIGYIIIGVVILFILLGIILPKHYTVPISINIQKPQPVVFDYVKLFAHQNDYSEWLKMDPTVVPVVEGVDGTVGSKLTWDSTNPNKNQNVGKGEQEILAMTDSTIKIALRFLRPRMGEAILNHHIIAVNEQETHYECVFEATAKFPINVPSYLFGRKMIAKMQAKTFQNIKDILER